MRKKLKDVCMFYSGTGFPIQYQGQTKGEYPFYKVGDIANNAIAGKIYLELCNNYISSDVAKMIKGCILPKDTVVFAKIGEALKLNRRAITSCDCLIDNNAMGIAPKLYFLRIQYFYFCMKNLKMQTLAESTTVPSVRKTVLEKYEIEVPSLVEQEEIEKKLTLTQKIIEKRRQELSYLDEIIKARFVEMFGTLDIPTQAFEKATLKELCNKITDGKHGGCKSEVGTERYFVGAREIYDDDVHYESAPEINIEEFEKDYKRCNVEIGDFLIVNTGATIGKSAIACDKRTEHTLLQKSVALLKVKKDVLNPIFLKWCYRVNTKMYMVENASAQPNLLLSKINATVIYVPDIELQNQFADFVHQVDKSKVAVQKALDETQMLFDSLMQEYFG